jgi:HEAT repeat protein
MLSAAALLLSGMYWWSHSQPSVVYRGKSADEWFSQLSRPGLESNDARQAFIRIGSNAVPYLVARLTEDPWRRSNYFALKMRLPLSWRTNLPPLPKIDWAGRINAARVLGDLGTNAIAAVPALVKMLSQIEMETIDTRGTTAATWHPKLRIEALAALEKIGLNEASILNALIAVLNDRHNRDLNDEIRIRAIAALEKLPDISEESVSLLLSNLEQANTRHYSTELSFFVHRLYPGGTVGLNLSELYSETNTIKALNGTNPTAVEAAAFELGDVDREGYNRHRLSHLPSMSREAAVALANFLGAKEEAVRLNAAEALIKTRQHNLTGVVNSLVSLLESTNSMHRLRAIEALRGIGTNALVAPEIANHVNDPVPFVSTWAAKAVREMEMRQAQSPTLKQQ